jgi:hypothetical protein
MGPYRVTIRLAFGRASESVPARRLPAGARRFLLLLLIVLQSRRGRRQWDRSSRIPGPCAPPQGSGGRRWGLDESANFAGKCRGRLVRQENAHAPGLEQITAETLHAEGACRAADRSCLAGRKRRGRDDPQIQCVILLADVIALDQAKSPLKLGELGEVVEIRCPRARRRSEDLACGHAEDQRSANIGVTRNEERSTVAALPLPGFLHSLPPASRLRRTVPIAEVNLTTGTAPAGRADIAPALELS